MCKLDWGKLLCEKRSRDDGNEAKNEPVIRDEFVTRNEFEADYDRIVGSSSVRRLQDKAQVFPLQKNDFVRTRLTHSMEVSAVARSLGKTIGLFLEEEHVFKRNETEKLMGMLQTAGLIHDLGNPPFGHYGETAIRNWYIERILGKSTDEIKKENLTQEQADFCYFDGNVQNLRIVTKLQTMNDEYGANFTYGTLAAVIKYPYSSINSEHKDNKFGYFKSEEDIIKNIREKTGLDEGVRHPATYLLEAADDIVYIGDDIEDGVKKGYIPWKEEYAKLKETFGSQNRYKKLFEEIDRKKADPALGNEERLLAHVRMFRNYVQGHFIKTAIQCFKKNYNSIMEGAFGLADLLEADAKLIDELKGITGKFCFACEEVVTLEVVGERVIKELLDIFYKAVSDLNDNDIKKKKTYAGKIYHLISDNYKYIALFDYNEHASKTFKDVSEYERLHLIVDFVSGMTDSYAVSLYKKLLGISLPE